MTDPAIEFVLSLIIVTVGWGLIILLHKRVNPITYFSSHTGLGILKGIVMAIGAAVIITVLSRSAHADEVKWFKEAEIFAGLEATQRVSPQCVRGGVDDKTTSNLGMRVNIYTNKEFQINSKYTHHSCAFGEDDAGYDALGLELVYKFWSR